MRVPSRATLPARFARFALMRKTASIVLFVCATAHAQIAPPVDHHQHLLSPATAALVNSVLPEIQLPHDLADLLKTRTSSYADAKKLEEMYAEDVVILGPEGPGWIRGRREAAALMGTVFARPFVMTPAVLRTDQNSAHIAGYLTRQARPIAYFLLDLRKRATGKWEIAAEVMKFPGPKQEPVVTAENLIALLDEAHIKRAVVLSNAYYFDSPRMNTSHDLTSLRAENDWTAEQVRKYPQRLVAFCSVNPLGDYAVEEIDRCAKSRTFKGLKLHFGAAALNLLEPAHVAKLKKVVEAANRNRLALIIHVRASGEYDARHTRILLREVFPLAPDVTIQIAHLWGGENFSEPALTAYAEAIEAKDPAVAHLYFDLAQTWFGGAEDLKRIVALMRRIGLQRILYATDGPEFAGATPVEGWKAVQERMPLTAEELRAIAGNVAPYLR